MRTEVIEAVLVVDIKKVAGVLARRTAEIALLRTRNETTRIPGWH